MHPAADAAGRRPCVRFVSFSGIDGAGKSTQIDNLRGHLERAGYRVVIVAFWDQIARLKRLREGAGHTIFQGDAGVGTPEAPIERRDKNVRGGWMTLIRTALYTLDTLSLCWACARLRRGSAGDVVIFDRYIYDELANLSLEAPALRLFVRTILRVSPRPHAPLVLDAIPSEARARKPEYPLDFLVENRASYLQLGRLAGLIVIPPMPVEEAKCRVVSEVAARFGLSEPGSASASADR